MARLKKEKRVNLRKERARNHKVILNISIVASQGIMLRIITRNRSKIKKLEQKPKSQIKNGNPNRKGI
jgi:hypothetical protein